MVGKTIERRSIVLLLDMDPKTADEITSAAVGFLKQNFKLKDRQIELNKRAVYVQNFIEVDEK
jgi:hypothetical protein